MTRIRDVTAAATLVLLGVVAMTGAKMADRSSDDDGRRLGARFEWQGRIAPGRAIEIKGVNGEIRAGLATGREVEVEAQKSGRRSDPDQVEIEVIEHEGGVTICTVYPSPRGEPPNVCAPGQGGRMNTKNNDVKVSYMVRVPAGVGLIARTVNGGIEAEDLRGNVEATTVNGSIHLSTSELAHATTVNGSIEASLGSTDSDQALEFQTVNGGIRVELPSNAGARVHAETVNGDISTDFPLTVTGRFGPRKVRGTIGNGGPELELTTVNGDIRLRSRGRK